MDFDDIIIEDNDPVCNNDYGLGDYEWENYRE